MSQGFCARCGTALLPGSAFCGACGAPVAAGAPPASAPYGQPPAAHPSMPAPGAAMPPPTTSPPGYVHPQELAPGAQSPQPAKKWGWQRWLLLVVGAIFLLSGLRQLGILPGRAPRSDDARSRALIGRWAGDSSCRGAMTFNADGTYAVHTGATARWRFDGDQLILSGDGAGQAMRLVAWSDNSVTFLMGPTALRYTMVRC